jgi:hypothetical protein
LRSIAPRQTPRSRHSRRAGQLLPLATAPKLSLVQSLRIVADGSPAPAIRRPMQPTRGRARA